MVFGKITLGLILEEKRRDAVKLLREKQEG
jgi:hypothetical protein